MAKEKVNLYILAIVAIVAVVGIVVLVLNAGTASLSLSDDDLTGQAARMQSRTSDSDTSNCQCGTTNCMNMKTGEVYECCKACR